MANDTGCKNKGGECGCIKYCAEATPGTRIVRYITPSEEDRALRDKIDEAEDAYQQRSVTYPGNMKITARYRSLVKELDPEKDLTGYTDIVFGEGDSRITICANSGKVVIFAAPGHRLVIFPANSESVWVESK